MVLSLPTNKDDTMLGGNRFPKSPSLPIYEQKLTIKFSMNQNDQKLPWTMVVNHSFYLPYKLLAANNILQNLVIKEFRY